MTSFRPMITRRLIVRTLPALALMTVAAGCGSITRTTSTTGNLAHDPGAAAFAYVRCLREHGLPNVPDPQVTTTAGGGSIRMAMPHSAAASPRFNAAQKACRGILPGPGSSSPGEQQAHRTVLLAFAHCLRSHGLTGFPDPTRDGDITQQMISAAGIDTRSSQFQRAGLACVGVTHGTITPALIRAAANPQN